MPPAVPTMTGPRTVYVVSNGTSGPRPQESVRRRIGELLERSGQLHRFIDAKRGGGLAGAAALAAREAAQNGGALLALGGDGTLSTVADAAWRHDVPLAVLPQGTFNFFARQHRIGEAPEQAVAAAIGDRECAVQVGMAGERIFLVSASLGMYPKLIEDREAWSRRWGRSRTVAVAAGLMTLLGGHRPFSIDMLDARGWTRMLRANTLLVDNNPLQLHDIGLLSSPQPIDGHLVAVLVRPVAPWRLLQMAWRGALGQLASDDQVESFAFDKLTLRVGRRNPSVKMALDGEIVRLPSPLRVAVAPRPLRLLLPPAEPAQDVAAGTRAPAVEIAPTRGEPPTSPNAAVADRSRS